MNEIEMQLSEHDKGCLRRSALELALNHQKNIGPASADEVVKNSKIFETYLLGDGGQER